MFVEAAGMKGKFYGTQVMVTAKVIEGALDDYRWNSIVFQLDSLLSTLSAEQPEVV